MVTGITFREESISLQVGANTFHKYSGKDSESFLKEIEYVLEQRGISISSHSNGACTIHASESAFGWLIGRGGANLRLMEKCAQKRISLSKSWIMNYNNSGVAGSKEQSIAEKYADKVICPQGQRRTVCVFFEKSKYDNASREIDALFEIKEMETIKWHFKNDFLGIIATEMGVPQEIRHYLCMNEKQLRYSSCIGMTKVSVETTVAVTACIAQLNARMQEIMRNNEIPGYYEKYEKERREKWKVGGE